MINRLTLTGVALALVLLPSVSMAADPAARFEQRDANQLKRIEQGVQSGRLTRPEAARLLNGERRIDQTQARALSDSRLSNRELGRINRAQNVESRRIYRQKHDLQGRW